MIKASILEGDFPSIKKLVDTELEPLVDLFPEIRLQLELMTLAERVEQEGAASVIRSIKEKYSEFAATEIILCEDSKLVKISLAQLIPKIIMCRNKDYLRKTFDPDSCKCALWEKVNSSILSSTSSRRAERVSRRQQPRRHQRTLRLPQDSHEAEA